MVNVVMELALEEYKSVMYAAICHPDPPLRTKTALPTAAGKAARKVPPLSDLFRDCPH